MRCVRGVTQSSYLLHALRACNPCHILQVTQFIVLAYSFSLYPFPSSVREQRVLICPNKYLDVTISLAELLYKALKSLQVISFDVACVSNANSIATLNRLVK